MEAFSSLVLDCKLRDGSNAEVCINSLSETFKAKKVIAVGGDLKLEDCLLSKVLTGAIFVNSLQVQFSAIANLDLKTESEAQIFEFFVGYIKRNGLALF